MPSRKPPQPPDIAPRAADLPPLPVALVVLDERLPGVGGQTITMRKFTTREYLAIRRRQLSTLELVETTLAAIVDYVPGHDPLDLAPEEVVSGILEAWISSRVAEAVPPQSA